MRLFNEVPHILGAQAWASVVDGIREAVENPVRGLDTIAIVVGVPLLVLVFVWLNVRVASWLLRALRTQTHDRSVTNED